MPYVYVNIRVGRESRIIKLRIALVASHFSKSEENRVGKSQGFSEGWKKTRVFNRAAKTFIKLLLRAVRARHRL